MGLKQFQLLECSRVIKVDDFSKKIHSYQKFISSSKYQSNENTNVCLKEIKDCLENIFL